MGRPKIDAAEVFFNNIEKLKSGCWKWKKEIHKVTGYGRFRASNITWNSHRFSFFYHKGEIPKNFHVHHLCNNRWCVNPKHLKAVSGKEHVLSGNTLTGKNLRKTHCKNGHKFTKKNTLMYRRLKEGTIRRICRACRDMSTKKYRSKHV